MLMSETFYSIQGEGKLIGTPSIFIRTAGCNLRCRWCDTAYAFEGKDQTIESIVLEVERYNCKYVVITGGEPTIQKELEQLVSRLKKYNHHITLETNGTKYDDYLVLNCDLVSISPKLSNSGSNSSKSLVSNVNSWLKYRSNGYIKFLV